MKRSRIDDDTTSDESKKFKISFENLPNEIVYEIFNFLNHFDAYQAFYFLNKRFQNLFSHSDYPLHINLPSISISSFKDYYRNVLLPNKQRISSFHLSNPFTIDTIFSSGQFIYLEKLSLDNTQPIRLTHLSFLPRLHSLTIHSLDCTDVYLDIFRLPKLKFCEINLKSIANCDYQSHSIECLIIKSDFQFHSLPSLFFTLPELRSLTIDSLDTVPSHDLTISNSTPSNKLNKLSIKLDLVDFNHFEALTRYFLRSITYLRISTGYDPTFLNARRWESLINDYLPNLRVFDLNHDGLIRNQLLTYHECIEQFNSSFWSKKQWTFTHQHDWQERIDAGIFHSTNPYRYIEHEEGSFFVHFNVIF